MTVKYAAVAVIFSTILLLLWLYKEYRRYCLDSFRQKLFSIRDDLFFKAKSGQISFDSDAYKIVRSNLNGLIRCCHELSLVRIWLARKELSTTAGIERSRKYRVQLENAIKSLSDEERTVILKAMSDSHRVVFTYISLNSILAITFTAFVVVVFLGAEIIKASVGYFFSGKVEKREFKVGSAEDIPVFKKGFRALDVEVNEIGCLA